MKLRFKKCLSPVSLLKDCCIFRASNYTSLNNNKSSEVKKLSFGQYVKLIYYALFFNEGNDSLVAVETMLQPFIDIVNVSIRYLSKFFVLVVWVLTLNMLNVFYQFILPEIYEESNFFLFSMHFFFGNLLAVNVFFNYWMGWRTSPGHPPMTKFDNVVTVCKKCLGPKPARSHHCSVCKKCVLKMDHHCPWFDNCIGFYNHRYFFLFCTYITLSCMYLSTIGFYYYQLNIFPSKNYNIFSLVTEPWINSSLSNYHMFSTIEFFITFAMVFAVGGLASFNAFIISNGTTNIEIRMIKLSICNSNDQTPNIYDLGLVNNWKLFLGFHDYKSFLMKVLLPSSHKPVGDGVNWYNYMNYPKLNVLPEAESFVV